MNHSRVIISSLALCAAVSMVSFAVRAEVSAPVTAQASGSGLEEVTVTARRREEVLQNVPVAVTAITSAQLRTMDIQRGEDLQRLVPGLTVAPDFTSRQNANFSIRGQGRLFAGGLPSVVTYFNEMPLDSQGGADFALFDLDSAQVLRGPQGTLFGRNANGGAVLLTPKAPGPGHQGDIDVSAGNLHYWQIQGAATAPLTDKLSLRVSGVYTTREGFTHNLASGKNLDNINQGAWRLFLRWQPTDSIRNDLIYQGLHASDDGSGYVFSNLRAKTATGAVPSAALRAAFAAQQAEGVRTINSPELLFNKRDINLVVDTLTVNLNNTLTLKNIASYERTVVCFGADLDGQPIRQYFTTECKRNDYTGSTTSTNRVTGLPIVIPPPVADTDANIWNEELQLQGTLLKDNLNWVAGGFVSSNTTPGGLNVWRTYKVAASVAGTPRMSSNQNDDKSYAVYAQGTAKLDSALQGLSVTGGYRYTWDDRANSFGQYQSLDNGKTYTCVTRKADGSILPPGTPIDGCIAPISDVFKGYSYTLSLDYKATDDILAYVATRRGYKAGGFNAVSVSPVREYNPETVKDVEVGLKTQWRSGDLSGRFNIDYYYGWYDNLQRQVTGVIPGAGVATIITNDVRGTTDGVEAEFLVNLTRKLSLSGDFSWSEGRYSHFEDNGFLSSTGFHDVSRSLWLGLPKTAGTVTLTYDQPLPDNAGDLVGSATYFATGRIATVANNFDNPEGIEPGYSLLNARLAWRNVLGRPMDVDLWGNNLTDKVYGLGGSAIGALQGFTSTLYGPPRTFGIEFTYHFGDTRRL